MNNITSIITRQWKSLVALNLIVIAMAGFKIKTASKVWSSQAQLIMPDTGSNLKANLGTLGSLNSSNAGFSSTINPLIAQQTILTSNVVMERMLEIDPKPEEFSSIGSYKGLFEIEIAEKSTTMTLIVASSSSELAQERARNWINVYQERLNELRKHESLARVDFSQDQLTEAKDKLNYTQQQLAEFETYSGLVSTEAQTQGMVSLIDQLTSAKLQAETQALANEKRVAVLSSRLAMSPEQAMRAVSLSENQDYQKFRDKLREVEIRLKELSATHTENNPLVRDLRSQREELLNKYQQYIDETAGSEVVDLTIANNSGRTSLIQQLVTAETEAEAQRKEANELEQKISQLRATLQSIPVRKKDLQKLQKEQDVAEGVYQGLIAKIQQTKIDSFNSYPQVQVLEPPTKHPKLVSPDKMLIKLNALLASIVGSTALVILLEKRNPLLKSHDLNSYNFPIISCIHQLKYFGKAAQKSDNLSNILFSPNQSTEIDFQRLASAISLKPIENRRLLITSAIAGEGKTTVTVGLAKALVDLGFRVLMVDADFHKAELTKTISSMTLFRETFSLIEQTDDTPIEILSNLYLQTARPQQTNTAALVKQGRFEQNIASAEARNNYDYIIVDSAPVSLTSETALMAETINNVLFVVRPNSSERNSVYSSFEQLNQHQAKILGLVVNGVETNSRHYSYTPRSLEASRAQIEQN